MTMYVFCSECGWKPNDFLDLTQRQLNALMKGRERWIDIQNEAQEDANEGKPRKARRRTKKGYREKARNIAYNRETGVHSVQGGSGALAKAVQGGNKEGSVKESSAEGAIAGLAQAGAMKSRVWRGGVKKEDRPRTKSEKLKKLRAEIAHNDKHFGTEPNGD